MDLEIMHIGNLLFLIKIRVKHLLDLEIFSNWNIGMLVDCEITQMENLLVFTIFRTGNLMNQTLRFTKKHPFAASQNGSSHKTYTFCLHAKTYILLRYNLNTPRFHVR